MAFTTDVVIIGGCGRVGLPLGIALASRGLRVQLFDINREALDVVAAGDLPFREHGALEPLRRALAEGTLVVTSDPASVSDAEHVVVTLDTGVDEHQNPDTYRFLSAIESYADRMVEGQIVILRSTLYPGVTALVESLIARHHDDVEVAFCPERIAEGQAMVELFELPQIVGARTSTAADRARKLFEQLGVEVVSLSPEEAEFAKLFTNTWRYTKFAIANQLFMIANDFGLDYERVREAVAHGYPRAADVPRAGFAAGPCLFKDTVQLAAFNNNNFTLGQASMMINEGLPLYLVSRLEQRFELASMTVGVLGMAFKAESDDVRSSLSYKLKRILQVRAARVLCTDPYVQSDADLLPVDDVVRDADLLVIGAPHERYRELRTDVPIVDIWNLRGEGVRV